MSSERSGSSPVVRRRQAELADLSVTEAVERIRRRELTPSALVEALLGRISELDPKLRAWVTVDREGALATARLCEAAIERADPPGPLHGIPVGVKDIVQVAGLPMRAGSPIFAHHVPTDDATAVARLRAAGAIILGKTVTTEFATGDPPPTRNPWNLAHTPGGSSSGSAAAVAARMCPAAIGTQTGGSTLRPAAYTGIVGLKPSYGRISRYGILPVSWSLDTVGIFARGVGDAALLLRVLAGHDPLDPTSSHRPVPDYPSLLGARPGPPTIGLVREFFYERADSEVCAHTDAVVHRLAGAGATVEEIPVPTEFARARLAQVVIDHAECAAFHEPLFRAHASEYSANIRARVTAGLLIPAVRYLRAQRFRRTLSRTLQAMVRRADVLLTPATPSPAPGDLSTTGDPIFQSPWTFAGLPTISIPSGLSRSGLPLGIQLVGAPFREEQLLAAAHWCETTLGVQLSPPVDGYCRRSG